jgi:histidine triad (HIT) family protein
MNQNSGRENCVFCQIMDGTAPAYTVYKDDEIFACLDKFPITARHTLVMPRKHVSTLVDLDEQLTSRMFNICRKIGSSFYAMKYSGVNYFVNEGADAGQVIFHVHCHVIPRNHNDGLDFRVRRSRMTDAEMSQAAESIRKEIMRAKDTPGD